MLEAREGRMAEPRNERHQGRKVTESQEMLIVRERSRVSLGATIVDCNEQPRVLVIPQRCEWPWPSVWRDLALASVIRSNARSKATRY